MDIFPFFSVKAEKGNSQIRRHSLCNLIFSPHYTQESTNLEEKKANSFWLLHQILPGFVYFFRRDLNDDKTNTWPLKRGWMRASRAFKNAAVWGRLLQQQLRHKFGWCLSVSVLSQRFLARGDPEPQWALLLSLSDGAPPNDGCFSQFISKRRHRWPR